MKAILTMIMLMLSSCIQDVPINLSITSRPVVITGLIHPGNPISLNISYLIAFSDSTFTDAPKISEISILQDGFLISNPISPGPDIYTSIYPKEGSEYFLIVRTESDTLTASTTIPGGILLSEADLWFSTIPSQKFERPVEASMSWEDPARVDNYYELQILDKKMKALNFYQFDQIDDPVIQQECGLDYAPSSFVFSDKQFNGKSFTLHLRFGIGGSLVRPDSGLVVLRNLSKEYYYFKKSWHKHIFLQNNSIKWDGNLNFTNIYSLLFQGDPVSMFTNVQEGLGIFAGFSQDIRKFKFIEK